MTTKVKDVLEAIKEVGEKGGIIQFPKVNLKLSKHDKKAIALIEEIQDYSMGDGIEILQTAILWLALLSSITLADKEIASGKDIMFEVKVVR